MGVPAVLRIFSDDHDGAFFAEWASPEKTLPALARWIENCRTDHLIPTATNYRDFVATDEGDHFRDDYPTDTADPADIQYRYVVRTGALGNGWIADLTVWRTNERPDREPLLTVWHQARFSNTDTSSVHELAFRGILQIINSVRSLDRPHLTAPALRTWTGQASWHHRRAGVA